MWKVYLFMFIVVVIVSILWVHLLSNQDNNYKDED
jgi:hypothetical protein